MRSYIHRRTQDIAKVGVYGKNKSKYKGAEISKFYKRVSMRRRCVNRVDDTILNLY